MSDKQKIELEIKLAQQNSEHADIFIEKYMPFIRSETAKNIKSFPSDGQDELNIAMFAFYECICAYKPGRGSFLKLAAVAIRNRIIDYRRKEERHSGQISLDAVQSEQDTRTLGDKLAERNDEIDLVTNQIVAKAELEKFADQLSEFGISLSDIADNCPQQKRTMDCCMTVLDYARKNPSLLSALVKTKKLPLKQLVSGACVERKSIERHRKYVVAILLAYTNGYEIIRGHLNRINSGKGFKD